MSTESRLIEVINRMAEGEVVEEQFGDTALIKAFAKLSSKIAEGGGGGGGGTGDGLSERAVEILTNAEAGKQTLILPTDTPVEKMLNRLAMRAMCDSSDFEERAESSADAITNPTLTLTSGYPKMYNFLNTQYYYYAPPISSGASFTISCVFGIEISPETRAAIEALPENRYTNAYSILKTNGDVPSGSNSTSIYRDDILKGEFSTFSRLPSGKASTTDKLVPGIYFNGDPWQINELLAQDGKTKITLKQFFVKSGLNQW